ncbi:MAG: hypothetical protein BroJett011_63000 [Chloroflexota bacterium]|nr:MAG: hypothetical protein BroJett011_63000 [Chloroflexota bacterium]
MSERQSPYIVNDLPVERAAAVLEQRLATALAQIGRLDLERGDLAHQAITLKANNKELTATINRCLFQIEELREDLAAERAHVLALLRVADYARRLTANITLFIGAPEQPGSLSAAELYRLANEALGEQ